MMNPAVLNFQGEYLTRGGLIATVEAWDGEVWTGFVAAKPHPAWAGLKAPATWDSQGNAADGYSDSDLMQRVKTPDEYALV